MDITFLLTSILSTAEIFFSSTAGIFFAYSFFRTYKSAQKDYEESKIGSLSYGPSYEVYEENGKYYVADIIKHNNSREISKNDYIQYQEYQKFDYGHQKASIQVKKERILAAFAVMFIFISSGISINKLIHSIPYSIVIDLVYLIVGLAVVLLIKALVDKMTVKVPSVPESIKAYEEEFYTIKL